jgi:hypothetical protein
MEEFMDFSIEEPGHMDLVESSPSVVDQLRAELAAAQNEIAELKQSNSDAAKLLEERRFGTSGILGLTNTFPFNLKGGPNEKAFPPGPSPGVKTWYHLAHQKLSQAKGMQTLLSNINKAAFDAGKLISSKDDAGADIIEGLAAEIKDNGGSTAEAHRHYIASISNLFRKDVRFPLTAPL